MAGAQSRTEFSSAISQICAERGIEPEVVIETIKSAILAAYRKEENLEEEEGYVVELDEENGGATIFQVDEDGKKKDVTPPGFGRIAAQTAKQVILQRVREAEKDAIIGEYQDKVDTMITGMVLRFDGKNVIYDIGRGQAYMPPEDQIPTEFYKMNQRMAVYIKDIRETMRGNTIIVSRSTEKLVEELFSREVPEVSSGAVEIVAIAREAGLRTKIAVDSTQDGVDPVGSCVGQKGVRVQEVINELNNEKIDIIQYSDDMQAFMASALAPADNLTIILNDKKKTAQVTVPDDQLSLAIGKGGQNVRLAAKLTGYKIDIKGTNAKAVVSASGDADFEIDEIGLDQEVRDVLVGMKVTTFDAVFIKKDQILALESMTEEIVADILKKIEDFTRSLDKITHVKVEKKEEKAEDEAEVESEESDSESNDKDESKEDKEDVSDSEKEVEENKDEVKTEDKEEKDFKEE